MRGALTKGSWKSKALYDARWQFKQISLKGRTDDSISAEGDL